jgi:GNAT superfamily N-acetyltransferase
VNTTPAIEFRGMTHADIKAGLRLCRLSRWDQVARDWERFLAAGPSGATAAVRDGRVIGSSATIRYGARFGWVGMVLVDPAAQGEGLGTSLLTRAIESLHDVPAIRLDATPAGHQLYLKHGFIDECRLRRMEAATIVVRDEPHPAITAMTSDDLPEVTAMDLVVFGAPRAELLEWMHAGAPEYAMVARRDGRLAGYGFGRHGFEFEHLGPIVAIDARMAEDMTAACLSRHGGRAFVIDATCHAGEWIQFLEQAGFREQRPFIRMHRGGQLPFGEPHLQFAVLGPEFG